MQKNELNFQNSNDLAEFTLGFCVSTSGVDSVIVGIRTESELDTAIQVAQRGKLPDKKALCYLGIEDEYWLNPEVLNR